MTLRIIGAGFGRTGTGSLRDALEILGYERCYHMFALAEDPSKADLWYRAGKGEDIDWQDIFGDEFVAAVDWPACSFYKELMTAYPDAKVILTLRDPQKWWRSTLTTIYAIYKAKPPWLRWFSPQRHKIQEMIGEVIWRGTFDDRFDDKNHAIGVYNRHLEDVRNTVPGDKLLEFEVTQGWGPLCAFLGVPVPDRAFPHANENSEMRKILWQRRIQKWVPAALAALLLIAFLLWLF